MRSFLFGSLLFCSSLLSAQITGQVKDFKTGASLNGAEVFFDKGINRVFTDENGYFIFEGLPKGTYKIGCMKKGYQVGSKVMTVNEGESTALFNMKKIEGAKLRDKIAIQEIVSKISKSNLFFPEWDKSFSLKSADLRSVQTGSERKTSGIIEFINPILGYKIQSYLLDYSEATPNVLTKFEPLIGNDADELQWAENRFLRYQLGMNNFLEAVLQNTTSLHGYRIVNESNLDIDLENSLIIGLSGENNILTLNQKIKVSQSINDVTHNSWIEAFPRIIFTDNGLVVNPDSVKIEGVLANTSLSGLLPNEFTPPVEAKHFNMGPYFEKAYVQTDKSYYFPGDTLWFNAYMNYKTLPLIESLSKVLYVELIDQKDEGRILSVKKLKIDDGEARGEFLLSDTISSDFIAIRAYTNWQLNYGKDQVFVKYFPFVKRSLNLRNQRNEIETSKYVSVQFNKPTYNKREKIRMAISVVNEERNLVSAWMSVSVTDRSMVRALNDSVTITNTFPIRPYKEPTKIKYPLERGLNIDGQFFNNRDKPTPATMMIMSNSFPQAFNFDTDVYGKFSIHGLDFADSADVRYTAKAGQFGYPLAGKVIIKKNNPLPVNLRWPLAVDNFELADFKIEKNTTLLNEVIVKGNKIALENKNEEEKEKIFRPFGEPNHILEEKDLGTNIVNIFEMIRGRVPGVTIVSSGSEYSIKFDRVNSMALSTEPAVFVDDVPMGGSASMSLQSILPTNVAAIEFITSPSPMLGSQGSAGALLVYTKTGGLRGRFDDFEELNSFDLVGFSTPAKFSGINHAKSFIPQNSDFRSTIHWATSVITDTNTGQAFVEFFASDSAGPYLITTEGVTVDGIPFRDERLIEINDQ